MTTALSNIAIGQPQIEAAEMLLAKQVAEKLHEHYPGQMWAVSVERAQFIVVRNLNLSGQYGYRIDIPTLYSASELARKAIVAGGELLERFNASRTRRDVLRTEGLRKDFSGRFEVQL